MAEHGAIQAIFKGVTIETRTVISPESIRGFIYLVKSPEDFIRAIKDNPERAINFLEALIKAGHKALVSSALVVPNAIFELAYDNPKQTKSLVEILECLNQSQRTNILSTPYVLYTLARTGQLEEIVKTLEKLDKPGQARILATNGATSSLANNGGVLYVINTIKSLEPSQITDIFVKSDAIHNICKKGHSEDVMKLLKERLSPSQQVQALLASGAILSLTKAGHTQGIIEIIDNLEPYLRSQILINQDVTRTLKHKGCEKTVSKWTAELVKLGFMAMEAPKTQPSIAPA